MTYINPSRTSKNIEGDFYTTGYGRGSEECGDCLDCCLPENLAPSLLADIENDDTYTHFIKQPTTAEEVEQACEACESCCVSALRYGGTDINLINRLGNNPEYCDYIIENGELKLTLDSDGQYLPYSAQILKKIRFKQKIKRYFSLWYWKLKLTR